jgi:hypothetical protein
MRTTVAIARTACRCLAPWLIAAMCVLEPAAADIPHLSAAMGYGAAGLFHEDYVDGALYSQGVGKFTAGMYLAEVGYLFGSHIMLGARVHGLRVGVGDGVDVGDLDLLPATLFVAYRQPALIGRVGGVAGVGAGAASIRFTPASTIDQYQPWDGDAIRVTEERPFVFEVFAGADVRLSQDLALEITGCSTLMDTELAYRPRPVDGSEAGFTPAHAFRVKGRHLFAAIAWRWWVELW